MQQLVRQCKEKLSSLGFDLFVPFSGIAWRRFVWWTVQHYNGLVQKRFQVPDYGRENTLAVLIGAFSPSFLFVGNTRNLWTPFIQHLCDIDYQLDQDPNPLDSCSGACFSFSIGTPSRAWLPLSRSFPLIKISTTLGKWLEDASFLSSAFRKWLHVRSWM